MEHSRTILRENGVFSMFDVESARFEANGKLTISRRGSLSESFLRINNGYLSDEALDSAGKTTGWLEEGLKKEGVVDIRSLFCVERTPEKGFYVVPKDIKARRGRKVAMVDNTVSN